MHLKKLILWYLKGALIVPIIIRIAYGSIDSTVDSIVHPGLFIHLAVLFLLSHYFLLRKIVHRDKLNLISKMVFVFFIVYSINLSAIEILLFSNLFPLSSIQYTLKLFLFLLISFYVYQNHQFFRSRFNRILKINSWVLILNIVLGYHFNIGWQSYGNLEGTYRGFLAGNDTSIFSFVVFGFSLFSIITEKKHQKILSIALFGLSIYSMYIIATKAIFIAGIICILFILNKQSVKKDIISSIILLIMISSVVAFIINSSQFQERIVVNYLIQKQQSERMIDAMVEIPKFMMWMNQIAPSRAIRGFMLLNQLVHDNPLNLLFGYGVSGIHQIFGRPPMAHLFSIIGHYGVIGFSVFYLPQFIHAWQLVMKRNFTVINVLYISVFLYGSLGGFLYNHSNSSIIFALLFALSLSSKNITSDRS